MKVVAVLLITLSVAFAQNLEAEAFVSERDINLLSSDKPSERDFSKGWNENGKPNERDVLSGE